MSWFIEFFGFGEKARAYILVKWQVFEGAYHFHAERCVRRAGLYGWMRVVKTPMYEYMEIEVEGQKTRIERLLENLREAPPNSRVTGIELEWKEYGQKKYHEFRSRN